MQKLISNTLRDLWRRHQDQIFLDDADIATVYYPITVSGTESDTVDNWFGESLNPNDPLNVDSSTQTQSGHVTISGRFRTDLYGTSIGAGESIERTAIGNFGREDVMFSCKYSDAVRNENSAQFNTWFNGCDYVTVSGYADEYEVKHVGIRGLKEKYACDIVMTRRSAP